MDGTVFAVELMGHESFALDAHLEDGTLSPGFEDLNTSTDEASVAS